MMKYDNEQLVDKSACAGVRADLKMCLLQSDCCKIVIYLISIYLKKFNLYFFFRKRNFLVIVFTGQMDRFQWSVRCLETLSLNAKDQL